MSLGFLAVGLAVTTAAVTGKFRLRKSGGCALAIMTVWCLIWNSFTVLWLASTLLAGWRYTQALREGLCEVAEGTVEVLHLQPAGGYDPGDRIRVDGREFQYSDFEAVLAYRQTVSHGGVLRNGAKVRLHYLHERILKVEVAD
jgi:hypothetical protein